MSQIIERGAWSARPPKKSPQSLSASSQKGTAVHYSAGPAPANHEGCYAQVRSWQNFHMNDRGWNDLAYSACACPHGYLFMARGIGIRTAANGTNTGNTSYHAVCAMTNGSLTPGHKEAINLFIDMQRFAFPHATDVKPHSHFKPTSCPGDQVRGWLAEGRPLQPGGNPSPAPTPQPPSSSPTPAPQRHSHPTPVLRQHSQGGEWVKDAQRHLNAFGARLKVDGIFGANTRTAVVNFQRSRNLSADGVVGPKTWTALHS